MALLRLVTVSGADDKVDIAELMKLSKEFPFVEWGILHSEKRAGSPRYPSAQWLHDFFYATWRDLSINMSLHLCGAQAREMNELGTTPNLLAPYRGRTTARFQVNGLSYLNASVRFRDWARGVNDRGNEVILQLRGDEPLPPALTRHLVSFLQDDSGGRGVPIAARCTLDKTDPECFGVAGGLNPENVATWLAASRHTPTGFDFSWIDMESGARNERDEFDLGRVRSFLEQCREYVEPR